MDPADWQLVMWSHARSSKPSQQGSGFKLDGHRNSPNYYRLVLMFYFDE